MQPFLNPFNNNFVIHYTLIESPKKSVAIKLVSSTGAVLKTIIIDKSAIKGTITVNEPSLTKGGYIVTLFINGEAAISKTLLKN